MNSSTTNIVRVSTNTDGRIVSYYARDKTPPTVEPGAMGKDQAVGTAIKYVIDTTKINNITGKEASAQVYHLRRITGIPGLWMWRSGSGTRMGWKTIAAGGYLLMQ